MIYLHLGVHKTATTYLQDLFALNQGRIASAGRAYWRLDQIRGDIDLGMREALAPRRGPRALAKRLLETPRPPLHRLRDKLDVAMDCILSEENLLGFPHEALRGQFYVNARERLGLLAAALGDRPAEVWLCIRAYPGFLGSLYAEALRHGYHATIAEFTARNQAPGGQWRRLVETIHRSLPEARIVVWRFEDFRTLEPVVVERLSGVALAGLRPLAHADVRPSPSAKAVVEQSERAGDLGRAERTLSMAMLEDKFPLSEYPGKFDPWDNQTLARMNRDYTSDIASLRSLPFVEFLHPDTAR